MSIVGVAVPDERPLAGKLVGWMFVVGAIATTLLPLLPGVAGAVLTPTLAIGVAAFVWGLLAVFVVDWRSAPTWVIHLSTVLGGLSVAVATHDTGGAHSPARFLAMLVLVYAAYFFPPREAWPYLAFVLALHELPLAYDESALSRGMLGELLIVAPCYWLLAFLLITGKQGMISLRVRADELARTDPLTGLANRRALLEAMEFRDRGQCIGLLMLDVDDFKRVNTEYGHPGGDRALCFVADCLRPSSRSGDLPARWAATSSRCWCRAPSTTAWRHWPCGCSRPSARATWSASASAGRSPPARRSCCTTPTTRSPPPSAAARIRRSRPPEGRPFIRSRPR